MVPAACEAPGRGFATVRRAEAGLRGVALFEAAFFADPAFFFGVARAAAFFAGAFLAVAFFVEAVFFGVTREALFFVAFFAAALPAAARVGGRFFGADFVGAAPDAGFPAFTVRPPLLRSRVPATRRDFVPGPAERPPRATPPGESVFFLAMRRQV